VYNFTEKKDNLQGRTCVVGILYVTTFEDNLRE